LTAPLFHNAAIFESRVAKNRDQPPDPMIAAQSIVIGGEHSEALCDGTP